jgi:hypothetical protein
MTPSGNGACHGREQVSPIEELTEFCLSLCWLASCAMKNIRRANGVEAKPEDA